VSIAANNLFGGADAEIGIPFQHTFNELNLGKQNVYSAFLRWVRLAGNEDDYRSAFFAASDVYARWPVRVKRVRNEGTCGFWYTEGGFPFADAAGSYVRPVNAQVCRDMVSNHTTASYMRGLESIEYLDIANNSFGQPGSYCTATIGSGSPYIYVGLAAKFYTVAHPVTSSVNTSMMNLGLKMFRNNQIIACMTDYIVQLSGGSEALMLAPKQPGWINNPSNVLQWFRGMGRTLSGYYNQVCDRFSYRCRWTGANSITVTYDYTAFSNADRTFHSAPAARTSLEMLCKYLDEWDLMWTDSYYSLKSFGYTSTRIDVEYNDNPTEFRFWDIMKDFSIQKLATETDAQSKVRWVMANGFFYVLSTVNVYNIAMIGENKSLGWYCPVPFQAPTGAIAWSRKYSNFHAHYGGYTLNPDVVPIPLQALPVLLDIESGNAKMNLALSNGRQVTATDSGPFLNPMLNAYSPKNLTSDELHDDDSYNPEEILFGQGVHGL
jgi:hypothetical protein